MASTSDSSLLARLLYPVTECFTPTVAKEVLQLRADPQTQARVDELAEKANEGSLTAEEQAEYETYIQAIDLIAILQAKSREILGDSPNS